MAIEDGEWIMRGLDWDDPSRTQSWEELIGLIDEVGFLPLFKNEVDSFSAEENTSDLYWWTGDEEQDPWEWRRLIARSGRAAYGKFFGGKAGFISRAWFPHFANWREGRLRLRQPLGRGAGHHAAEADHGPVPDQRRVCFSFELKRQAGFGKGGEKNFEGTVTDLQMGGYLLIRDFRRRRNKRGQEYGWHISVYSTPETLWGYDHVSSAYSVAPAESKALIDEQIWRNFPEAEQEELDAVLGWTR